MLHTARRLYIETQIYQTENTETLKRKTIINISDWLKEITSAPKAAWWEKNPWIRKPTTPTLRLRQRSSPPLPPTSPSLTGVNDLHFGLLAHVLCVVKMSVATTSTIVEPVGTTANERETLAVVHQVRLAQQNDLWIRLNERDGSSLFTYESNRIFKENQLKLTKEMKYWKLTEENWNLI